MEEITNLAFKMVILSQQKSHDFESFDEAIKHIEDLSNTEKAKLLQRFMPFAALAVRELVRSNPVNNPKKDSVTLLVNAAFENSKTKGFWDVHRNIGEMLMLIVSELGEAIEAHRHGHILADGRMIQTFEGYLRDNDYGLYEYEAGIITPWDDHRKATLDRRIAEARKAWFEKTYKDTFEDEIADTFIRLFDMCGGLGINIVEHISQKMQYNAVREHLNGKKY